MIVKKMEDFLKLTLISIQKEKPIDVSAMYKKGSNLELKFLNDPILYAR